mgnify:CR=1 FL=1
MTRGASVHYRVMLDGTPVGGLTAAEAGAALGLTERQVLKRWTFARGWLRRELSLGTRDD